MVHGGCKRVVDVFGGGRFTWTCSMCKCASVATVTCLFVKREGQRAPRSSQSLYLVVHLLLFTCRDALLDLYRTIKTTILYLSSSTYTAGPELDLSEINRRPACNHDCTTLYSLLAARDTTAHDHHHHSSHIRSTQHTYIESVSS
jgi:hypothetical protein